MRMDRQSKQIMPASSFMDMMSSSASSNEPRGHSYDRDGTQASRPPTSLSSSFRLRPRSNSHQLDLNDAAPGFAIPAFSPANNPHQYGANTITISPDCPMYSSTSNGDSDKMMPPPPTFASFYSQAAGGAPSSLCSSPIKKQKTQDRLRLQLSPDTSPSENSEDSRGRDSPLECPSTSVAAAAAAPVFPSFMTFPKSPAISEIYQDQASYSSSKGKRTLPPDEEISDSPGELTSSPFTPRGRQMMQNLCINSPSPTLSSVSPTPKNSDSSSQPQLINQTLPTMPTFSFSPSLKDGAFPPLRGSISRCNTMESSSVREKIVFSAGSTPLGTPKRGPPTKSTVGSANSSPFHSSFQRTPIGQQRGSVFKTLPPRLYPNGRDDSLSVGSSANENNSTFVSSSPFSTSSPMPSPRVVPLTILSRNGSPLVSPKTSLPQLPFDPSVSKSADGIPSQLMRSLDQVAKEEEDATSAFLSPRRSDVKMPSISMAMADASPLSSGSGHHLPRIKLTPRGKKNFASAKLDSSPGSAGDGLKMPRLSLLNPAKEKPASLLVMNSPDNKAEAEMDSLLNGFEHHKSAFDDDEQKKPKTNTKKGSTSFDRVESEEAEMVALTQGPFHMPALWLPPSAVTHEKSEHRHSSFTCSVNSEASHNFSPGNHRPMPSITLNLHPSGQDAQPSKICGVSPSFLPRPVPVKQNKSRSLFDTSPNARDGALERIIRADAIAEAARSDEPLTDEDSDIDGDDADFLLCLPQSKSYESHPPRFNQMMCHHPTEGTEQKSPFKPSCAALRAESPLFNRRAESPLFNKSRNGSFLRRSKLGSDHSLHGLSSPTTPTIFEEGIASSTVEKGTLTTKRPFHPTSHEGQLAKRETSDATFTTFCSLSDCDASEIMASPKYLRTTRALGSTKDRQSVCSLLSMSSLCGLDIVHETSLGTEVNDKVPMLLPSGSSAEFSATMFKPLPRSELSLNSLGLSVDSADAGVEPRDLFTPPVAAMGVRNTKQMLSPPPLRCRAASPLPL